MCPAATTVCSGMLRGGFRVTSGLKARTHAHIHFTCIITIIIIQHHDDNNEEEE